jgi:hypothetical protein
LYNIGLAEQEYRTKQLKALEDKAAEDISLLKSIIEVHTQWRYSSVGLVL